MRTTLPHSLTVWAALAAACAALLGAGDVAAQAPEAPEEAPAVADGAPLMQKVGDVYAKLKTWQGSIDAHRVQKTGEGSFSGNASIKVALQKPDKLRATVKSLRGRTMTVIWNADHLTLINEDTKKYMTLPLPGLSYDVIATHERAVPLVVGSGQLLSRLVSRRPAMSLTGGAPVEQLARTKIGEVEVEHLRVKIPEGYRHIYVSPKDQSVVRIEHDPAEMLVRMAMQDPAYANAKFVFHVTMKDQVFNAEIPADTFTFTPAEGYTKVRLAGEVFKAAKKPEKPEKPKEELDTFGEDEVKPEVPAKPTQPKKPKDPGKKEA
jgi:outer membrane lipoprotein-sorting protein